MSTEGTQEKCEESCGDIALIAVLRPVGIIHIRRLPLAVTKLRLIVERLISELLHRLTVRVLLTEFIAVHMISPVCRGLLVLFSL